MGGGSEKHKRGTKNSVVQKGRKGRYKPWYLGIRFVLLIVCWDVYRIPVGFRIILPKTHPEYRNENMLIREMVEAFYPPTRATTVIVLEMPGMVLPPI